MILEMYYSAEGVVLLHVQSSEYMYVVGFSVNVKNILMMLFGVYLL